MKWMATIVSLIENDLTLTPNDILVIKKDCNVIM